MKWMRILTMVALVFAAAIGGVGCEKKGGDGVFENTGEKMDKALEDAGDAVKDAAEDAKDAAEDAAEDVKEKVNN